MIRNLLTSQKNFEKTAIIDGDREITYHELRSKALALRPLLPPERENVAILLPNGGDYIAAFWGVLAAGMTAFPLSVLMTIHEIEPLFKQAGVKTLITSTAYRRSLEEAAAVEGQNLRIIYMEEFAAASSENALKAAEDAPEEPMVLLSTSGTTGKSKIVMLSENNVRACVTGYLDKVRLDDTERENASFLLAAPFSSVYGIMILTACLIEAVPIVIISNDFTLDALCRAAEKHRVTHYEGGGSTVLLMEQMIGRAIPYDISALTYIAFGGSKISSITIESLQSAYPHMEFFQGYGMTEAAPLITKHQRAKVLKTDSVGTAIKGMEIYVETDRGIVSTPYVKGEIVVRGPNVMLGYYDNEDETKRVLQNGYLYTGDIGYLDDEGYLYICGRKKNIIIVRGFNVYPEEVEECIKNSRLVKDCVVYGRPDAFGGEVVCADIVPIDSHVRVEAVYTYCGAHLAGYKRPMIINLCDSINKNASGKTKRRREEAE